MVVWWRGKTVYRYYLDQYDTSSVGALFTNFYSFSDLDWSQTAFLAQYIPGAEEGIDNTGLIVEYDTIPKVYNQSKQLVYAYTGSQDNPQLTDIYIYGASSTSPNKWACHACLGVIEDD